MTGALRGLLLLLVAVALAGCGSTPSSSPVPGSSTPSATAGASPTATATGTVAPTPTIAGVSEARQAVVTLLSGTAGEPGTTPCFLNAGQHATDYAACPVTDRLATRLPEGCGWQEFLYGNGASQHVTTVGDAMATTGGATVRINTDPPNGGFVTDAVLLQASGRWLVDDLVRQDQAPLSIYATPTQAAAC